MESGTGLRVVSVVPSSDGLTECVTCALDNGLEVEFTLLTSVGRKVLPLLKQNFRSTSRHLSAVTNVCDEIAKSIPGRHAMLIKDGLDGSLKGVEVGAGNGVGHGGASGSGKVNATPGQPGAWRCTQCGFVGFWFGVHCGPGAGK